MSRNDGFVDSGGLRIAVRDHGGSGQPLVHIHGHFGNLAEADHLAPLLTDHLRVVAYDQRGQGWSEAGPISVAAYVDDLNAVIGALGLERPVLFGSSFGSLVAVAAIDAGVDIAGFVNEDGFVTDSTDQPRPLRDDGVVRRIVNAEVHDQVLAGFGRLGPHGEAIHHRTVVRLPDGTFELRPTQSDLDAKVHAFIGMRTSAIYRACAAPVLVLFADRGDDDHRRTRDAQLAALETAGPLEIRRFSTGHAISAEVPDQVAEAVLAFVATLAR
jgi:pimeloyl-ACP methyl ester carboxylesterase